MEQIYFVRHGNADYINACLTERGKQQVKSLSSKLEALLPDGLQVSLISSPSQRALETARLLLPLMEKKSGNRMYIDREENLSELRSMDNTENLLINGKSNLLLIEKYDKSEYGFFVAHEKIIAATCIAITEANQLPTPEFLRRIEYLPDKTLIAQFMEENISREEAIEKIKSYGYLPPPRLPPIAEASAIHIDLVQKQVNCILPD